jgi:catechol 2,3-dioxygenase-like lactoylglutathione lyase family enzyme
LRVHHLLRIEITVADLAAAEGFYAALPGISVEARGEVEPAMAALLGADRVEQVRLRRGAQTIVLQQFHPPGAAYPADRTSCDQRFQHLALPVADAAAATAGLSRSAAPISRNGAQPLPPASGSAIAFKFRDPEGHPLELIQFADGHLGGVDHSAIVSADVERSIAFYRDQLGFTVASRQTNRGPEQDRLDGLTGTIVDVVALAPVIETPHVELLAYHSPPVRPAGPRAANDIAATRLVLAVDSLPEPGVTLADGSQATVIGDPDGHLLLLQTIS